MSDIHDYPLAEVLGTGDTIHQARPVGLLGSRIETRCGLQGSRSGRDGGAVCAECVARERAEADTHDERGGDEAPICSTPCDPGCDAVCHEDHVAGHKKRHWPYDCPAAERYSWGGSDFIAAAVKRLRGERDEAREELTAANAHAQTAHDQVAELGGVVVELRADCTAATERADLAEAQVTEIQAERNEWQRRAQRGHVVADILRADLAAATAHAGAAEAELGRVNKRTDFLDDALKGLRQQAIEAVKERNAETARAEKAKAERDQLREYVAALNEAQVSLQSSSFEVGWWKGFKATPTAGVYTQAYLDTVEYADGLRALAADAVQDGLSATETGGEGNCPWCGTLQKLGVDGLVLPHEHPTYADECPGTTRRPSYDATEGSGD